MNAPLNFIQFIGSIEMGLIYSLVTMGVYLSFRTLQFPDMTVDGSFPLGAAVTAILITTGTHPYLATLGSIIAGAIAGSITSQLSIHLRILNLLAGILTMTALYSLNIRIMKQPNITLLGEHTLFNGWLESVPIYVSLYLIMMGIVVLIYWFLNTRIGLAIRAAGNNAKMARAQGINDHAKITAGLSVSNALVAFAGSLFTQVHGFADVTMGVGTIISGLAAVIIGEAIFPTHTIFRAIIACILGTIIYRLVIAVALNIEGFGLEVSDLNLVTAMLVAIAMFLLILKQKILKKEHIQ